jgi:hypothetical protein
MIDNDYPENTPRLTISQMSYYTGRVPAWLHAPLEKTQGGLHEASQNGRLQTPRAWARLPPIQLSTIDRRNLIILWDAFITTLSKR